MTNSASQDPNTPHDPSADTFDRGIVPAETAARKAREGENYKQTPEEQGDMKTDKGYTVSSEGLVNNFAIEPEMYVEEPGDLQAEQSKSSAKRQQELDEVKDTSEDGKLTVNEDDRGKGVGVI